MVVPALSFKVEDRGGRRTLERLGRTVRDLRPAWPAIIDVFKEQQEQLFATEGQEAGGWRPLSPAYARAKSRRYPGRRIHRLTGGLEAAATGRSSEFRVVTAPLLLVVRIGTYYARFLDVSRDLSPLTRERVRAWTKVIESHVARAGASS